jgi:hypothetical protein
MVFRTLTVLRTENTHTYLVVLGCHPRTMPSHAFLMVHMNFGVSPFKTREATFKIVVSGSSRCAWNCIFTHSETHPGLVRARNTNLCALASENMWYSHILIQLLTVQILYNPTAAGCSPRAMKPWRKSLRILCHVFIRKIYGLLRRTRLEDEVLCSCRFWYFRSVTMTDSEPDEDGSAEVSCEEQ